MTFSRYSIYIIGALFAIPASVLAQNIFVTEQTQEKIRALQDAKTLATILVQKKPVIATSTISFKTTGCTQSKLKDDSMYFLQIINDEGGLPSSFVPKDLVNVVPHIKTWVKTPVCMTRGTAVQLYAMVQDMAKEKMNLAVVSAYRSYNDQKMLYKNGSKTLNSGSFDRVAPAGKSEHQLGTALDVSTYTISGTSFGTTTESAWLQKNAHKYGFIISYNDGSQDKTGYMYEPWHLRYVGVENATLLKQGEYTLSYKSSFYKQSWMQTFLGKIKQYIGVSTTTISIVK